MTGKGNQDKKENHYEEVSGIKVGHARMPALMRIVTYVLIVWAIGYAAFAPGKLVVSGEEEIPVNKGEKIVQGTCMSCHASGAAPVLKGVTDRLSDDEIKHILKNGRNTMPALANLYSEEELDLIIEYLGTYK